MDSFPVCTHCGFTWGEYRARGLLGCPHCYAGFGEALQADIAWLHHAAAFAGFDAPAIPGPAAASGPGDSVRLRERIAAAVRAENYEEAARLKRLLEDPAPPAGDPPPGARKPGGPQPGGRIAGGQRPGLGLV